MGLWLNKYPRLGKLAEQFDIICINHWPVVETKTAADITRQIRVWHWFLYVKRSGVMMWPFAFPSGKTDSIPRRWIHLDSCLSPSGVKINSLSIVLLRSSYSSMGTQDGSWADFEKFLRSFFTDQLTLPRACCGQVSICNHVFQIKLNTRLDSMDWTKKSF